MVSTARRYTTTLFTVVWSILLSGFACADPAEQPTDDPASPPATPAAIAVDPQDYETHGGGGWRFYTENNINCVISETVACLGDPLPGTDSEYTVATMTGDSKAQMTWTDTQIKPFGHPFDATKFGRLLPSGSSLSVPLGRCQVSGQTITCMRGGSRLHH